MTKREKAAVEQPQDVDQSGEIAALEQVIENEEADEEAAEDGDDDSE